MFVTFAGERYLLGAAPRKWAASFAFVRSLLAALLVTGALGLALAFAATGTGDSGAAQDSVLLTTCLGSFKRIGRAAGKLRAPPLSIIC